MKTKFVYILLIVNVLIVNSQSAQISDVISSKNHIPVVIPPSPSVASLMMMEDIPVSQYTGIPNISLPVFSTSGKFGFPVSVSLSYHPGSIKKNEVASSTGLGWNLIAGGTISRTVMDIPDDYFNHSENKYGIYHTQNTFYNIYEDYQNNYTTYESFVEQESVNKFMFESNEKQSFDSRHDLYQYNFNGYSGKFIIRKTLSGFEIVKFDYNNLIIEYLQNGNQRFFKIKDENGFEYIFDVIETTVAFSSYNNLYLNNEVNNGIQYSYTYDSSYHLSKVSFQETITALYHYTNSLPNENYKEGSKSHTTTWNFAEGHVDNDYANSDLGLINFINSYISNGGSYSTIIGHILPRFSSNVTNNLVNVRKIKQIDVIGKAKIYFNYQKNVRNDFNLISAVDAPVLKEIKVENTFGHLIKKYELTYDFLQRTFLTSLKELANASNAEIKHEFLYDRNYIDPLTLSNDYWGYFRKPVCNEYEGRDVDLEYVTKDVLYMIKYPTGGAAFFEFESNQYSYIGNQTLEDNYGVYGLNGLDVYNENPKNWITQNISGPNIPAVNFERIISIKVLRHLCGAFLNQYGQVSPIFLRKRNSAGQVVETINLGSSIVDEFHSTDCEVNDFTLEANHSFEVVQNWLLNPFINPNVNCGIQNINSLPELIITQKYKTSNTVKHLFGGGIRIKNIKYLNDGNGSLHPSNIKKQTTYDYSMPGTLATEEKSSGSLAFPKPIYNYYIFRKFKRLYFRGCNQYIPSNYHNDTYVTIGSSNLYFKVVTNFDNQSTVTTQGAYVGYKFVSVKDNHEGEIKYEFTSPLDFPEVVNLLQREYPFVSKPSLDYRRGNKLKEEVYNTDSILLKRSTYQYEYSHQDELVGFKTFYTKYDCPHTSSYNNYETYKNAIDNALSNLYPYVVNVINTPPTFNSFKNNISNYDQIFALVVNFSDLANVLCCGWRPYKYLTIVPLKERRSISRVIYETSEDFFNQNLSYPITQSTHYTYHDFNYQIKKTRTNLVDEEYTTSIFYPMDSEVASEPNVNLLIQQNRLSTPVKKTVAIHDSVGSSQTTNLAEEKITYQSNANTHNKLMFSSAQSLKIGQLNDNDFNTNIHIKRYDANGNILEKELNGGTAVVSYIWAYNHSLPVAKLENIRYDQIPQNLIQAIQSATDGQNYNESSLLTALNNLRISTNVNLQNAMITTYTHKPLIGISTVTDPKGDRQTFIYDEFNRLKFVKDRFNNILSENQYHYKTQN